MKAIEVRRDNRVPIHPGELRDGTQLKNLIRRGSVVPEAFLSSNRQGALAKKESGEESSDAEDVLRPASGKEPHEQQGRSASDRRRDDEETFYESPEWKAVRAAIIEEQGSSCRD